MKRYCTRIAVKSTTFTEDTVIDGFGVYGMLEWGEE